MRSLFILLLLFFSRFTFLFSTPFLENIEAVRFNGLKSHEALEIGLLHITDTKYLINTEKYPSECQIQTYIKDKTLHIDIHPISSYDITYVITQDGFYHFDTLAHLAIQKDPWAFQYIHHTEEVSFRKKKVLSFKENNILYHPYEDISLTAHKMEFSNTFFRTRESAMLFPIHSENIIQIIGITPWRYTYDIEENNAHIYDIHYETLNSIDEMDNNRDDILNDTYQSQTTLLKGIVDFPHHHVDLQISNGSICMIFDKKIIDDLDQKEYQASQIVEIPPIQTPPYSGEAEPYFQLTFPIPQKFHFSYDTPTTPNSQTTPTQKK